ncbi:MAG: AMP-binding protein [Chloroflexota bacterium]
MTLAERLLEHVQRSPDQPAISIQHAGRPDLALSYSQLWKGAARYAQAYEREALVPGEVVILVLQHGEDLVYAFWGAVVHGAVPAIMPFLTEKLSPEQYRNDLRALISVTRPAAVVTYPEFEPHVREALATDGVVRAVVSTQDVKGTTDDDAVFNAFTSRAANEIVLLQHSSGTTGLQKGVALSHRAVLNQLDAYGRTLEIRPEDVIVSWLPLYHDMGLIAGFLLPILSGIPLVLSSPFDWVRAPWRLLQAVSRYRGTLSWLPNFAYNFMAQKVRDRDVEGVDLASWRTIVNCSEPVRWESHKAFFNRFEKYGLHWESLQTSYAMAENVFGVTQSEIRGEPEVEDLDREAFMEARVARPAVGGKPAMRIMSSGKPLPNTRVRVVDDRGAPLPDSRVGEIAIQSDCMLTGYYNRPDADKEAFHDGWYLTGDYGYLSRGALYVAGRKKDMIIVGGKNIYPQDLEALSYEVPGIHPGRSVAFGVFDEELGTEDVCMVAEADTDDAIQQHRLEGLIRGHVTRNSAIALRQVRVVGPKWILKTSSGKVARGANREKFLRELAGSTNP